MSTQKQSCTPWFPTFLEKFFYAGAMLYVAFVFTRFLHELGHAAMNWVINGTFTMSTLEITWFFIIPMGTMHYDVSSLLIVLAGPFTAILFGWGIGLLWNKNALSGPCGGRNKWLRRRGIVYGALLQALWDAIYLVPVVDPMPFDGYAGGDGIEVAKIFREMGLGTIQLGATEVVINPAYLIATVAILGTVYVIYRVIKCTPLVCDRCRV